MDKSSESGRFMPLRQRLLGKINKKPTKRRVVQLIRVKITLWNLCSDFQMPFWPILDHLLQKSVYRNNFNFFFPDRSENSLIWTKWSKLFVCAFSPLFYCALFQKKILKKHISYCDVHKNCHGPAINTCQDISLRGGAPRM